MFNLKNKVAIVTGGRRGIGRTFVETLLTEGVNVVAIAKDKDSAGLNCDYISCDLSIDNERTGLIDKIYEKYKQIDILINNAGCQNYYSAETYPMEIWQKSLSLMVTAPYDLSRQVFPYMKQQGVGRIINVSSVAAFQGARNTVGYNVSKHALDGLTKCLAIEWASYGITVNCIAPGYIETKMLEQLITDNNRTKEMLGRIPVGRFGTSIDLIGALVFLCSDESSYLTGQSIIIDGGWRVRG